MRTTCNAQGSWRFMRIASGWENLHSKWTYLPMPNEVIGSVHVLARHNPRGLIFSNRNGQPLSYDDAFDDSDCDTYLCSDTDDSND